MKLKRYILPILALLLVFSTACSSLPFSDTYMQPDVSESTDTIAGNTVDTAQEADDKSDVIYGEAYCDLEHVVLYLDTFGELPSNYITKDDARSLGWEGGSVEDYFPSGAIGGDTFGNREGLLPEADGRYYTECDIDTIGESSRGAKRLVFSNDGLYFYTEDHYESFTQVYVEDGKVAENQ